MRISSAAWIFVVSGLLGLVFSPVVRAQTVLANVSPISRAVQVNTLATSIATIVNVGNTTALGCTILPLTPIPAVFLFAPINPVTNALSGPANLPVDIPAGLSQKFNITFIPTSPFTPVDVQLQFKCVNTNAAPMATGINTLLLSASTTVVPDILALAVTETNDGILTIPSATGSGAFLVASLNLGVSGMVTVAADTGSASLPVDLLVCRFDPGIGNCLAPPTPFVTGLVNSGELTFYAVFVLGRGVSIPLNPAMNRVFLRWKDESGIDRGLAGIAVQVENVPESFTLSGTISASPNAAIDSDVNDENALFTSNDTLATAQSLANPVSLGGYVNQPFRGPSGRSRVSGDRSDFFVVSLQENQIIELFVGDDVTTNDLDLYLYDQNGFLIDASLGTGLIESITVPTVGTFFVEVFAFSGASNYVLTIGQQTSTQTFSGRRNGLRLSADFVPGEMLVGFTDMESENGEERLVNRIQSMGMRRKGGLPGQEILLAMRDEEDHDQTMAALGMGQAYQDQKARHRGLSSEWRSKLDTLLAIKALRGRGDVKAADPNFIRYPLLTPNDEFLSLQWHYPLINLPQAWDMTTGSQDVIVAVVDTGVLLSHPDLQGKFVAGFDFISSSQRGRDGDGIDPFPDDPGDLFFGSSSSFHGTHVAGTVAALSNNSTGGAGVSWLSRILPVRVLGVGGGTSFDILQGVRFAAGLANSSGTVPAQRADIINLSLGGSNFSQCEQDVYTLVRNAGVMVIAAAGNEASNAPGFPAAYDGVVSVSAVDLSKTLAPYSNFGSTIDVAAPGGDTSIDRNGDGFADGVLSTMGDDSSGNVEFIYKFNQGTSMAVPHMAGVVALMKSVHSALTPDQLDALVESGTIIEDLGTPGRDDQFGHGLINARKAVEAAQNLAGLPQPNPTPILTVSPAGLNFGVAQSSITVTVANSGGGSLIVGGVSENSLGWLSVNASSVDANGLGTYTLVVNRGGLPNGTFAADVTWTSSANTVSVPIIMQVGRESSQGNAGYHYVLLVDSDTRTTFAEVNLAGTNGVYNYTFTGVAPGTYVLVAGSDSDNDNFICDAGEACGAFPTRDLPSPLNVQNNLTNLNFTSGFSPNLQSGAALSGEGQRPGFAIRETKPAKEVP